MVFVIVKGSGITLMTGDGPLRKAAEQEKVPVIGTIGVLDRLYEGQYIESNEYVDCLKELLKNNGQKIRLPEHELQKRVDNVEKP